MPDINGMIVDLYASVLDGAPLDAPLAQIAKALGGTMSFAYRFTLGNGEATMNDALATHNMDPSAITEYQNHWIAHDPWLNAAKSSPRGVFNLSRLVAPEEYGRSPFWNDFLIRKFPAYYGVSLLVHETDDVGGSFTTWRDPKGDAFDRNAEALMAHFAPHITRAFVAESRLNCSSGDAKNQVLDSLKQGILILGLDGTVAYLNHALRTMISAGDGLHLSRRGLRASTKEAQNALDRATGQALASSAGRGPIPDHTEDLALPRPSGLSAWVVEVLPLRADSQGAFRGFAGAVLIVTDTEARRLPSERLLAKLYGLSPAEASLASSLAMGATIAEHAALRGISIPTARTQLANVLSKTNTRRQAELVSKIAMAIM